jgi:hypothetical protein
MLQSSAAKIESAELAPKFIALRFVLDKDG